MLAKKVALHSLWLLYASDFLYNFPANTPCGNIARFEPCLRGRPFPGCDAGTETFVPGGEGTARSRVCDKMLESGIIEQEKQ